MASTTPRYGLAPDGLSRLPDGRYLRDAIEADPVNWLGPEHSAYFGASPALLVKLLDAGQRLPVHMHPPRSFAYRHLGSRHGKTEAWVIIGTHNPEPVVYLGWSRDVTPAEVSAWVASQDAETMLSNLNRLAVRPGDAIVVPAGTPHAIGPGVFFVELQEPSDFSIMLELEGFDLDPSGGELGLGRPLALSCVHDKAFSPAELGALRRSHPVPGTTLGAPSVEKVLADAADPYFRAQRVVGANALEASFAVVVGLAGAGSLVGEGWAVDVHTGTTVVVPWGAGPVQAQGGAELLRCLPPLPSDAAIDDPVPVARDPL